MNLEEGRTLGLEQSEGLRGNFSEEKTFRSTVGLFYSFSNCTFILLLFFIIYFWLCWVFTAVCGISLLAVSGVCSLVVVLGLPGGPVDRNLPANARDTGSIPGPGSSHMPQNN